MIKNKVKQLMTLLLAIMLLGTSVLNGGLVLVSNAELTSVENDVVNYTVSKEVSEDKLSVKITLQFEAKENIAVQEIVLPDGKVQEFANEQIEYSATENGTVDFLLRYTESIIQEDAEAVGGETAQSESKELTIQVDITGIQEQEETDPEDMTAIDKEEKTEMLEISNFSSVVDDVATINMADGPVTINDDGFTQANITIDHTGSYVLMGTYTRKDTDPKSISIIVITGGTEANPIQVTLDNVKIDNSTGTAAAIQIGEHITPNNVPGHVDMTLSGENDLKGGSAGIALIGSKKGAVHSTLAIGGLGKLTTIGGRNGAGIGSTMQPEAKVYYKLTINSGTIIAKGGEGAAGIGGGKNSSGGEIIINGGDVTSTGGQWGAGIGGGVQQSNIYYQLLTNMSVVINGGTVVANGGDFASGIGIGYFNIEKPAEVVKYEENTFDISIGNAGTIVTATGGLQGAGIGRGWTGYDGYDLSDTKPENPWVIDTIQIEKGAEVTAAGGTSWGTGIGANSPGKINKILIEDAKVSATGKSGCPGIGSCNTAQAYVDSIEITGDSEVTAIGSSSTAGIGTGKDSRVGSITISGGNTVASGGSSGPGIGAAENGNINEILIENAKVVANGGYVAPGIGSSKGVDSRVDSIEITGESNVTSTGGNFAAGIGTGENSTVGTITLSGGTTVASSLSTAGQNSGIGTGYKGGSINSVSITGDATVVATGWNGSGIGRAHNSNQSVIAKPFPIVIEQGTNVTAYAWGDIYSNGNFDAPYYSAIDQECITHANSNIADYILMGDFKKILNDAAEQEVVITNLKTRASKSVILPIGFASFATTVSEGFHRVLVNDEIFVGDPDKRKEDNLVIKMGGNENTLHAYWMLQPLGDLLVDYIFPEEAPAGINAPETVTVKMDDTTGEPIVIEPANWVFKGWYSDRMFTQVYDFSSAINSNLVLFGKWQYNAPVIPAPAPTSRPSIGRTCQDDGYTEGYYWSESAQACVIDKVGAVPTKANTPNTGDSPNYTLAVAILSLSAGLIILIVGKKKKKTSQ